MFDPCFKQPQHVLIRDHFTRRDFQQALLHAHAAKRFAKIDLLVAKPGVRVAQHLEHDRAQHLLAEIDHRVHVGVGPVKLEHRKLGIVPPRDALVTKVAIELVDFFEATHQQTLQIQLRGDARVKIDIERVVMCFEGTRRGPGRQRRQHRRFDFNISMILEDSSQLSHHRRAPFKHLARRERVVFLELQTAGNQIDVALALPNFGIVDAVHLVRKRQKRLRQKLQLLRVNRKLPSLGDEEKALDADEVTMVQ